MPKTIKAIDKAVELLLCFKANPSLGISELVNLTGMSKGTVYDLVYTLTTHGLLKQNVENKKYELGILNFEMGALYDQRNPITKVANTIGQNLAEKHGATIHLTTLDNAKVVYLKKYENPSALVSYSRTGKRAPLYCTGVGKAMLAFLDKEYVDNYLQTVSLESYTPKTIVDINQLKEEIDLIKLRGFSIDDEEIELGLKCVAAPIFNGKGKVVGAMSISKLAPYVNESTIPELSKDIIEATKIISNSPNLDKLF